MFFKKTLIISNKFLYDMASRVPSSHSCDHFYRPTLLVCSYSVLHCVTTKHNKTQQQQQQKFQNPQTIIQNYVILWFHTELIASSHELGVKYFYHQHIDFSKLKWQIRGDLESLLGQRSFQVI